MKRLSTPLNTAANAASALFAKGTILRYKEKENERLNKILYIEFFLFTFINQTDQS